MVDGYSSNKAAELIAAHYQHTYEVTYEHWRQRNRLFLFLLVTLGLGAIFALENGAAQGEIIKLIAGVVGTGGIDVDIILQSQMYVFLQSILVVTVFFLMFNLYHRSTAVLRLYNYLGVLEDEIRATLNLTDEQDAFTREGRFYWKYRLYDNRRSLLSVGLSLSKVMHTLLLAALLTTFFVVRLSIDIASQRIVILIFDAAVGFMTLFYYVAYVSASFSLDKPDRETNRELAQANAE